MVQLMPWKRGRDEGERGESGEHPLARLRNEFESLWDRYFGGAPGLAEEFGRGWGLDVDDRENEFLIRAEAPGFNPDEFNVQVVGNQLVIHADHKEEKQEEGRSSVRYGRFERMIPLPRGAQTEKIDARYRNGVLEIHVPKGEEAKGRRIAVKSE